MIFRQLFDRETSTYTYLIADPVTRQGALIDPVVEQVDRDLKLIEELGLELRLVLETHVHADHVTGASILRGQVGAETIAGAKAAPCADRHVQGNDHIALGELDIQVLATPGHTDDSLSYFVGDRVFTGDALLIRGTGRTDFQNGSPEALYDSITKVLFALADDTLVFPGHDYRGQTVSTIGEEKRWNSRVAGVDKAAFVTLMNDLNLPEPKRIHEAVPANRACGRTGFAFEDIQPAQLVDLNDQTLIIDVREADEYRGALGHIPGATLVPLTTLPTKAASWDRTRPIVTVCRSGARSTRAANILTQMGFGEVKNLVGGMTAYTSAGLPCSRD